MDFKWYQIALFVVVWKLDQLSTWVRRTSVWRFYRTHVVLEGRADAAVLRRAKKKKKRPRARGRALTLPLPGSSSEGSHASSTSSWWWRIVGQQQQQPATTTTDQSGSLLLTRLPQDVRVGIFELVLGGKGFHLSCGSTNGRTDCFGLCDAQALMLDDAGGEGRGSHGSCHVKRKENLLQLLLTCRQVYSEAVYVLYAANAFQFTQEFCLVKFVNALPAHRLREMRRLRHYLRLYRSPAMNKRTMADWEEIWAFFGSRFEGLTVLRVDIGMDFAQARRICDEGEDEREWLIPVVRSVGRTEREDRDGDGEGGRCEGGVGSQVHGIGEQRTLLVGVPGDGGGRSSVVNVNEAWQLAKERLKPGYSDVELERAVCGDVHRRIQDSIRDWLQRLGR